MTAGSCAKELMTRSGRERLDRNVGIAEIDRDDRHVGGARGADVGRRVPDHDRPRPGSPPARSTVRAENLRIGLLHAERILAADRGEALGEIAASRSSRFDSHSSLLVHTASRWPAAARRSSAASTEGTDASGRRCVRRNARRSGCRARSTSAGEQSRASAASARSIMRPRAAADHRTGLVVGHRRQSVLGQGEVERMDQVGRGIDQRAVEIEDDGQHDLA